MNERMNMNDVESSESLMSGWEQGGNGVVGGKQTRKNKSQQGAISGELVSVKSNLFADDSGWWRTW